MVSFKDHYSSTELRLLAARPEFDPERDVQAINELLSTSLGAEGLITNGHRYLLVATKVV